jgi:hypothetical protein
MTPLPRVRCRDCATLLGPRNDSGVCAACWLDIRRLNNPTDIWGVPVETGHFSESESATEAIYRADEPYERRPWWEEMS